jgi:uncharacterized protein YdhG (YjbR/CyaY superfamily)
VEKIENMNNTPNKSVDEYISMFPENVQVILKKLRLVIRDSAPGAKETISYGMPAFKLNGNLVFFAAWKSHIGFYGTPSVGVEFREELSSYERSKGTIKFTLDKPMPYALVENIVKFRVSENLRKSMK